MQWHQLKKPLSKSSRSLGGELERGVLNQPSPNLIN